MGAVDSSAYDAASGRGMAKIVLIGLESAAPELLLIKAYAGGAARVTIHRGHADSQDGRVARCA